jgi:hypothetical protein
MFTRYVSAAIAVNAFLAIGCGAGSQTLSVTVKPRIDDLREALDGYSPAILTIITEGRVTRKIYVPDRVEAAYQESPLETLELLARLASDRGDSDVAWSAIVVGICVGRNSQLYALIDDFSRRHEVGEWERREHWLKRIEERREELKLRVESVIRTQMDIARG